MREMGVFRLSNRSLVFEVTVNKELLGVPSNAMAVRKKKVAWENPSESEWRQGDPYRLANCSLTFLLPKGVNELRRRTSILSFPKKRFLPTRCASATVNFHLLNTGDVFPGEKMMGLLLRRKKMETLLKF
ncbi:hypothetical protein SAY87_022162 [Trapa incisa]|uniref:Uncharacterized protein n=1 Tax=Trapa incisa TaxID=236973 RepID=A0AAN7PT46_9MYRT|nr:hypothetical protein SAY87_022162 [Trapa incisa]